ncbi:hypothetical protein MKEN_00040500 [Mycena kentingensis (nom. inval.)]|nr:hypothetical protein MKEN_00040500 [Mycena kentingensis (nom. inval.)]
MFPSSVLYALVASSAVLGHSALKYRATPQVYDACVNSNDIALTFDDGPYIHLRAISDMFTNAGGHASFFFNGNNFDCIYSSDRIGDIKYAFAAGHMIGSHTWSHADLTTLSTAQIQDGMFRMEEALSRILGIKVGFMRPPFGSFNGNVQSIAAARGQSLALWDWDTGDADGNTTAQSEAVYNDIISSKVKNALVLEHETVDTTASTLVPFAINLFKSHGFNLVTMAQCLGVDPYQAIGVPQTQSSSWTCNGTPDPGEACGGSIACKTGTPVFSSTTAPPTGPTGTPGGQTIRPGASSTTCLTASSQADGAAVVVQPCTTGSVNQSWNKVGATLVINNAFCLDVTGGSTTSGTKMQIWSCSPGNTGNLNQQFTVTAGKAIQWNGHNDCVDLTDGKITAGNQVQSWTCTGGPNQIWNFV